MDEQLREAHHEASELRGRLDSAESAKREVELELRRVVEEKSALSSLLGSTASAREDAEAKLLEIVKVKQEFEGSLAELRTRMEQQEHEYNQKSRMAVLEVERSEGECARAKTRQRHAERERDDLREQRDRALTDVTRLRYALEGSHLSASRRDSPSPMSPSPVRASARAAPIARTPAQAPRTVE